MREELRAGLGELPSAELWRETAAGHAQDLGAGHGAVKGIEELVRLIIRYEDRFRADGLLPPDGRVTTTVAHDYGRAVNLARWGLSARFCDPHEAEQAIVQAGALSKSAYHSWEDFSAAYALGRVLHFDAEKYGKFYEQNVVAHRLLAAPMSHSPSLGALGKAMLVSRCRQPEHARRTRVDPVLVAGVAIGFMGAVGTGVSRHGGRGER